MKFTVDEFLEKLPLPATDKWKQGVWDVEPFQKGDVTLVFFAPKEVDYQMAHDKDEVYFIVRGRGNLLVGDERQRFEPGDTFFVAAGVPHHFENFSPDFATWAIFF